MNEERVLHLAARLTRCGRARGGCDTRVLRCSAVSAPARKSRGSHATLRRWLSVRPVAAGEVAVALAIHAPSSKPVEQLRTVRSQYLPRHWFGGGLLVPPRPVLGVWSGALRGCLRHDGH